MKTKIILLFVLVFYSVLSYAGIRPDRLTCENINNPMAVDIPRPRLSWVGKERIMFSQAPEKDKPNRLINLGDWVAPGTLPPDEMVHTFFLWRFAGLTSKAAKVLENGKKIKDSELLKVTRMDGKYAVIQTGSGVFNFSSN